MRPRQPIASDEEDTGGKGERTRIGSLENLVCFFRAYFATLLSCA
jgi:hypothetical protein